MLRSTTVLVCLFAVFIAAVCSYGMSPHDEVVSTIVMEAANQSHEGKIAVMNVVANRSRKSHKTFPEVVRQTGQFLGYSRRELAKSPQFIAAWHECDEIVTQAERGELPNVVGDALFFDQSGRGQKIGAHYFRKNFK